MIRRATPRGRETTYVYDQQGRKTAETNAIGDTQSWTYDYFGRLTDHVDLGGTNYDYAYNHAGLLETQTNSLGQNQDFIYDTAGHLVEINDLALDRRSLYDYDAAGRVVRTRTLQGTVEHEDTRTTYDALGRVAHMSGYGFSITYSYDAVGNRTRIEATYAADGSAMTQDLWYRYDAMNRVTVSQGVNAGGVVTIDASTADGTGTQGIALTYDVRGMRTTATEYGKRLRYNSSGLLTYEQGESQQSYTYDGLGRLLTTHLQTHANSGVLAAPTLIDSRLYDRASRVEYQYTLDIEGTSTAVHRARYSTYTDDGLVQEQTSVRNGMIESKVLYGDAVQTGGGTYSYYDEISGETWTWTLPASWTLGHDAAGNLRGYLVNVYNANGTRAYDSTNQFSYRLGEGYQQSAQTVTNTTGGPRNGSTTNTYNVNGELVTYTDAQDANKNRYFQNNAAGQALTVVKGNYDGQQGRPTAAQALANAAAGGVNFSGYGTGYFFYGAQGQSVGSSSRLDSGALITNFDVNYEPISQAYPAAVPQSYVVQVGDTLRGVAAKLFGDAGLWYLLAQENGLGDPDAALIEGTVLVVPNEVISLSNSASSFKPFSVSDAIGDTTPTQPMPPPPAAKKKGCGVLGQILVIVVAIVVTIYTVGAASGLAASYGSTFAAGSAVMTGTAVGSGAIGLGAAVGAAAVGGAVGSMASQGVAMATGLQDSFSWKGVALGAIGAGVTAGLGGSAAWQQFAGQFGSASGSVTMAAGNALTQGIGVVTGVQSSFSWREVAIAAMAAPVARSAGQLAGGMFDSPGLSQFASSVGSSMGGSLVRVAAGGKVDTATILADAFGNALGNSIVDGMSPQPVMPAQARGGTGSADELQEVQITARRLDVNPDSIMNPVATMSPDEQRNAQSRQAVEEVQVTALRRSDPLSGIEEVVVSAPRMTAQEARAYDAREALRMTLSGILTQHRREQDARNMVEAEMTAGQRALVSLGGIMYNGYQSVKSGVVGVADLATSAYEWNQRVVGDLLHGDIRAAAGEYADLFGLGAEKAKAFMAGAQNLGAVLGDAESRQMLMDFAGEYYGTSSQITQSELLGKLPMELLLAAGTAGAGQVISAAGIPQRIGGAINSLADALRAVDVRSPLVPVGAGEMGMLGIKGVQNPLLKSAINCYSLTRLGRSIQRCQIYVRDARSHSL